MSHSAVADQGTETQPVTTPPAPPAAPPAPQGTAYTEAQFLEAVARVRDEERARLSGPQKELADKLALLEAEAAEARSAREKAEADAKAERDRVAAEQKARDEEELSAKELLARREDEWKNEIAQLRQENAQREALFQKERERAELKAYIQSRVDAERDNIAPQFLGYIDGATREEVDASIATAIANTASILEEVRQAQVAQRQAIPGVSPTSGNVGPLETQDSIRTLTPEQIAALPVNSPEYQKLRELAGIAGLGRGQGMFQ